MKNKTKFINRIRLADGFNKKGELFSRRGYHGRALAYYTKAIEADGNSVQYFLNRASCYFALDQFTSSIQDSLKAITFAPKCLTSHQNICACKLAMWDKRGSCKAIQKCRLLSAEMAEALDTLKKAHVRLDAETVFVLQ